MKKEQNKNLIRWETTNRTKYSDKVFLTEGVSKMKKQLKILSVALPILMAIFLILCVLGVVLYFAVEQSLENSMLALAAGIGFVGLALTATNHFVYTLPAYKIAFVKWEEELKILEQNSK